MFSVRLCVLCGYDLQAYAARNLSAISVCPFSCATSSGVCPSSSWRWDSRRTSATPPPSPDRHAAQPRAARSSPSAGEHSPARHVRAARAQSPDFSAAAAECKGMTCMGLFATAPASAWCSSNTRATLSSPKKAAKCKGVKPSPERAFASRGSRATISSTRSARPGWRLQKCPVPGAPRRRNSTMSLRCRYSACISAETPPASRAPPSARSVGQQLLAADLRFPTRWLR